MRISDWSSDVCSSDLTKDFLALSAAEHGVRLDAREHVLEHLRQEERLEILCRAADLFGVSGRRYGRRLAGAERYGGVDRRRSEERRVGKAGVSTCRSRGSPYH